jgi:ankyrin repeat protein
MNHFNLTRKRAASYEEIQPLIALCKAGRLFDVQKWIASGRPINPPSELKIRKKSPLELAIALGFHSLVEVLLEGGALVEDQRYSPLSHALEKRRLDLILLLVKYGADPKSVSMDHVVATGDRKMIDYFIEQGGDMETGNPLALGLCEHIYSLLGVFKRYETRFPSFQEQINIVLRHSCREGNLKWVSLMLWAGADPYAKGPSYPDEKSDPESDISALELAALYNHLEIFKLKPIRESFTPSRAQDLLSWACEADKADLLKELLSKGFRPGAFPDDGSSLIQTLLIRLSIWDGSWLFERPSQDVDTSASRERIKMIHLLARHGAKWHPMDTATFKQVRSSLRKMKPEYILEFIWIMAGYRACSREVIVQLIGAPNIRKQILNDLGVVNRLIAQLD